MTKITGEGEPPQEGHWLDKYPASVNKNQSPAWQALADGTITTEELERNFRFARESGILGESELSAAEFEELMRRRGIIS